MSTECECDCSLVDMAGCAPLRVAGQSSLQSRIARSHDKVAVPFTTTRPQTYRGYSILSMDKACEAVLTGKLTVGAAAEEYGVPKSTLYDKVTGKVPVKA